jgi:hypothetical protein
MCCVLPLQDVNSYIYTLVNVSPCLLQKLALASEKSSTCQQLELP